MIGEDCWTEPEQSCWQEPREKCWTVPEERCWDEARPRSRYILRNYSVFALFLQSDVDRCWQEPEESCWEVEDQQCEDVPQEHCQNVNVRVARRKCDDKI